MRRYADAPHPPFGGIRQKDNDEQGNLKFVHFGHRNLDAPLVTNQLLVDSAHLAASTTCGLQATINHPFGVFLHPVILLYLLPLMALILSFMGARATLCVRKWRLAR